MSRVYQLGRDGEDAAQHLVDVYAISRIFEPCLLMSPHGKALDELRRRLAEKVDRLVHWEPGEDLAQRARTLAAEVAESGQRPVIWLQQKRFDAGPWRYALALLNQQRDRIAAETPWMWVLAGPAEMIRLAHEHAMHVLTGVAVRLNVYEEPRSLARVTTPARPIRWLHLSDFHFQALERWDRRATLTALLKHAEGLKERDLAPDFVFITGDVAFSGKRKEYEQAERFFTALAEKLGVEPRERFFLVPGNHDIDRAAIGPVDDSILNGLTSQEAIEQVLGDPRTMGFLARRLEEFYAFTVRFLGAARGWHNDRPWRVDVREVEGVQVGILQLNSAWTSGRAAEQGKLLVGEAQVRQALAEAADAFFKIALVHHPVADLADVDRASLEKVVGASGGIHFLLRGHLHRGRAVAGLMPDGFLAELAAGAAYVAGDYPKSHLLTEVDLGAGTSRVHFYRYRSRGQGSWVADSDAVESSTDGVWSFDLPPELKLERAVAAAGAPLSAERRATLTARYRAAAAAVHGTVRFVGFADSRPRRNVEVPELFVPLRLRRRGREEEGEEDGKKGWTTAELLRRLLRQPRDEKPRRSAARLVVLGDPGSGKTTLCRFAAVVLAGEHAVGGVEPAEELLPMLLPFREYVRSCREQGERSLLAFLAEQARSHLQVPVSEDFLEQALAEGRAAVLLDGLDEVGSAGEREAMRERVQAFCHGYPQAPVLVTSRIAGYGDAPLRQPGSFVGRGGSTWFTHLELAPFSDEDLRLFVSHWYGVQEPDDPIVRDRGIADLTAALNAEPRVRELAHNPMLATLVALIHRNEAHLPGERAALYDLCVKTLIETWPAARKRSFREIDERLQRAYLEALAWRMQSLREQADREMTIERRQLVEALVEIVSERRKSAEPEATRGLVERWVRHLEEGTGLLVEQRPGVFAFFHLSLMEYLAARGMEKAEDPVETIARRYGDATWREVCLLAVGSNATDRSFLDRLYDRLAGEEDSPERWSFLLRALREEAAFDDEQRAAIVRGAGRALLDRPPLEWQADQRTFDELTRLSIRHKEWARGWVAQELATARGAELQAIVVLRRRHEEAALKVLSQRLARLGDR